MQPIGPVWASRIAIRITRLRRNAAAGYLGYLRAAKADERNRRCIRWTLHQQELQSRTRKDPFALQIEPRSIHSLTCSAVVPRISSHRACTACAFLISSFKFLAGVSFNVMEIEYTFLLSEMLPCLRDASYASTLVERGEDIARGRSFDHHPIC
jgi:hypothetical protein